jgi:hypothetical protein
MALEISPVESFNQIKEINKMLSRNRTEKSKKEPEKKLISHDDEINMRAFILENTSGTDLILITKLIEICKKKGYEEKDIVDILRKMIVEKVLDTLNERYILRLDDSD